MGTQEMCKVVESIFAILQLASLIQLSATILFLRRCVIEQARQPNKDL
jgi:hypothetical protein